jgi:general stress protein 26
MNESSAPLAQRPHMPGYGVDTPEWHGLPWSWAAERLLLGRNFWVVTASVAGQPHSMPVWGVWHDDEQRFMFSCAHSSRKARNLASNPRMAFTSDVSDECVSVQGTAALVVEPARLDEWADRYVAKYGAEVGPELGDFVRQNAIYEVSPTVAFAVIERADEFSTRATRWTFQT